MKKILFLLPLLLNGSDGNSTDPIVNDGLAYTKQLLKKHTDEFETTIVEPMTQGGTLVSLDQNSSATVDPLRCSDTATTGEILSISYSSGNQIAISIRGDFDLDGSKEKSWGYSRVDGVCADGFIQCVAGWSEGSCDYHKWGYSANSLTANIVSTNSVNNCFCTNNSCGNVAVSQKKEILGMLLEGITNVIIPQDKDHVYTETKNTGSVASQFAISQDGCSNSSQGLQNGVSYSDLKNNRAAEKTNQDANPSDAYSFMKGEQNNVDASQHSNYLKELGDQENRLSSTIQIDYNNSKIDYYSDGNISGSAQLADLHLTEPIEEFCKVEIYKDKSVVYSDSSTAVNENKDMKRHSIVTRECDNGSCLYDSSFETIIEPCSEQTNNFEESMSKLQGLTEAAKDMVCTK